MRLKDFRMDAWDSADAFKLVHIFSYQKCKLLEHLERKGLAASDNGVNTYCQETVELGTIESVEAEWVWFGNLVMQTGNWRGVTEREEEQSSQSGSAGWLRNVQRAQAHLRSPPSPSPAASVVLARNAYATPSAAALLLPVVRELPLLW